MPHKADKSFFKIKREWSLRKDLILATYIKPYLAKVALLHRPILVVDGFAGPGKYGSGEAGSPVIIAGAIEEALARSTVPIQLMCFENDTELFVELEQSLSEYDFAKASAGSFLSNLPRVELLVSSCTTFLYVDPYAIEGLEWESLARIFRHVRNNRSVEILLNFSAVSFARRALAALSLAMDDTFEDPFDVSAETPSISRLNTVVGGDWWQQLARQRKPFSTLVQEITSGFCDKLREHFREVCDHPVKARWDDSLAKYSLIFASRSPDALVLMNNAAIKSRDVLADQVHDEPLTLFELRPETLVPDLTRLPSIVLAAAQNRMTRKDLVAHVVRANFCRFSESQIVGCVAELLKKGQLQSSTGKTRINKDVEIWAPHNG